MRGADGDPFLHVTHKGAPGFAGVAFEAPHRRRSPEARARRTTRRSKRSTGPAAVIACALTIPTASPSKWSLVARRCRGAVPPVRTPTNDARGKQRHNATKRVGGGAAHVKRLGHCVLNVSNFRASEAWYKERFGFITSDEIKLSPEFAFGAFMRCDRGEQPADHHTLFLAGTGTREVQSRRLRSRSTSTT